MYRWARVAGAWTLMICACMRPPSPVAPKSEPVSSKSLATSVDPGGCFSRAPFPDLDAMGSDGTPLTVAEGDDGGASSIFGRDTALDAREMTPEQRGALDREIVRRIIRRHINEVKACYEAQLPTRPGLAGKVLVKFAIAASGFVRHTRVVGSTMDNVAVEDCVARTMCGWQFPRPRGGGWVVITYPYVLTPAAPLEL